MAAFDAGATVDGGSSFNLQLDELVKIPKVPMPIVVNVNVN